MNWCRYLLLLACCVLGSAQAEPPSKLFDDQRQPTPRFQNMLKSAALPRAVSGTNLFPVAIVNGLAKPLEEDACLIMQFHITPQGQVDQYIVLDSEPEKVWEAGMALIVSRWQFEPSSKDYWVVLPASFNADKEKTSGPRKKPVRCFPTSARFVASRLQESHVLTEYGKGLFPPERIRDKLEGCATISFSVSADGRTDDFEALDVVPDQRFVAAAMQAVRETKFEPRTDATAVRSAMSIDFRIPELILPPPKSCALLELNDPRMAATVETK